jgi:predicted permease
MTRMRILRSWLVRLAGLFGRAQRDRELTAEIESHLQLHIDDNIRAGMSPAEARRQALLKFGGVESAKENYRDRRGFPSLDSIWQDVRYAFRLLRKTPSFTLAAVLTLAVAIGANTIVFSVTNALVIRPLNLPQEESVYLVERANDRGGAHSYPNYLDLRDHNHSFDGLAAYNIVAVALSTGQAPTLTWGWEVTVNYFDVLRIQPHLGRFFHASDERGPNSAPYLVLAYSYWQAHFQGVPGVIGRTVQLNKHPFTIIGVAPPDFPGGSPFVTADFYVPMIDQEQVEGATSLNDRASASVMSIIGHLKSGITPAQAIADLNSAGSYLEKTYPSIDRQMSFALEHPSILGGGDLVSDVHAFLAGLMLLAGLILLAACANLGSLFSARAADRSREIAMRLALGSSRTRILRQLFTEAILISLLGGAVGLWSSGLLLQWLSAWHPLPRYPVLVAVSPDARVYLYGLLLALVSGLLFGAVPIRQVLRSDPYGVIKSGWTGNAGRRITAREFLLAVQIAICAVLVTSSFVAVRGLLRSMRANLGVEPRNVLLADIDMNTAGYRGDAALPMQERVLEAMQSIPGAQSAGWVNVPPLTLDCCESSLIFNNKTTDLNPANAATRAATFMISPDFFNAAGATLLAGRGFTRQDDRTSPRVAIVNQLFATRVFGSLSRAVGQDFILSDGTRVQVVGVAEDGKYGSTTEAPNAAMFLPILQAPSNEAWLIVRSNMDSQPLAAAIRGKLNDLDPGLPAFIQTWHEGMDTALFGSRMAALSLGVLGILGAMLSVTGIFGMASYSVSKRKRELGIRIALGARRSDILRAALGRAVNLLAFGSLAGLLLGILASRVLASIVYQATPRDPIVLAGVVLAMLCVGLLATWVPAQRALAIDPAALMREE